MSIQNVELFYKKLKDNKELQQKFAEAGRQDLLQKLVNLGTIEGLEFTVEEIKAYWRQKTEGELNEEELEKVSGGSKKNENQDYQKYYECLTKCLQHNKQLPDTEKFCIDKCKRLLYK